MSNITAQGIRRVIEQKRLVQANVAVASGFTAQQFSDMLHGRKRILADYLPRIAAAMGAGPGEIFEENTKEKAAVLSPLFQKLVVLDTDTGKEIAVVTADTITTAADNIVVRLSPRTD